MSPMQEPEFTPQEAQAPMPPPTEGDHWASLELARRRDSAMAEVSAFLADQDRQIPNVPDATPEQLQGLKSGAQLSNVALRNLDLRGRDLKNISLTDCLVVNCQFDGAILDGATFTDSYVEETSFTDASMKKIKLSGNYIRGGNFDRAMMHQAKIDYTTIHNSSMVGVDMSSSRLTGFNLLVADLTDAHLENCRMHTCNWTVVQVLNTIFDGGTIEGTYFTRLQSHIDSQLEIPLDWRTLSPEAAAEMSERTITAEQKSTEPSRTSFKKVTFQDVTFVGILNTLDFSGSIVKESDFDGEFAQSNFNDSEMERVRFFEAGLTGSTFTGAILHYVNFGLARLDGVDMGTAACEYVMFNEAKISTDEGKDKTILPEGYPIAVALRDLKTGKLIEPNGGGLNEEEMAESIRRSTEFAALRAEFFSGARQPEILSDALTVLGVNVLQENDVGGPFTYQRACEDLERSLGKYKRLLSSNARVVDLVEVIYEHQLASKTPGADRDIETILGVYDFLPESLIDEAQELFNGVIEKIVMIEGSIARIAMLQNIDKKPPKSGEDFQKLLHQCLRATIMGRVSDEFYTNAYGANAGREQLLYEAYPESKKEYRRLARKYHPDINPGDKEAEEKFKLISKAMEMLDDVLGVGIKIAESQSSSSDAVKKLTKDEGPKRLAAGGNES